MTALGWWLFYSILWGAVHVVLAVEDCKICRNMRIYGNPMGELPAGWAHCPVCHRTIELGITHCGICHASFTTEDGFEAHRFEADGVIECLPVEYV